MSETPDQKLDRVTDEIVAMVDDWHRNDGWDEDNAKTHIRRVLRDECSELWEASAIDVEIERLEAWERVAREQIEHHVRHWEERELADRLLSDEVPLPQRITMLVQHYRLEAERVEAERAAICREILGRDDCEDLVGVVRDVLTERIEAQRDVVRLREELAKREVTR